MICLEFRKFLEIILNLDWPWPSSLCIHYGAGDCDWCIKIAGDILEKYEILEISHIARDLPSSVWGYRANLHRKYFNEFHKKKHFRKYIKKILPLEGMKCLYTYMTDEREIHQMSDGPVLILIITSDLTDHNVSTKCSRKYIVIHYE